MGVHITHNGDFDELEAYQQVSGWALHYVLLVLHSLYIYALLLYYHHYYYHYYYCSLTPAVACCYLSRTGDGERGGGSLAGAPVVRTQPCQERLGQDRWPDGALPRAGTPTYIPTNCVCAV